MKTFHNFFRICILLIGISVSFSSCKLQSLIPDSEFTQYDRFLENINGTYFINKEVNDSSYHGRGRDVFFVSDLVKNKDKELLRDKHFEQLAILYDGKKRITFCFEGEENVRLTYECKRKENYLEIYFIKRRIWALPLFMSYGYDRLRLGLDENSNLIVHKWIDAFGTLTIMPFDYFGGVDYSHTLARIHKKNDLHTE